MQGVSNMLWSFAKLGYFPQQPVLIKAALEYFVSRPKNFKLQEICNLMWALTQLRWVTISKPPPSKHTPQVRARDQNHCCGPQLL